MKIVIIGDGKVGHQLATQLSEEDHDLMLIDNKMSRLKQTINELDVSCLCGEGDDVEILKQADVHKADIVIACTNSDSVNMISCLLAKKLGAKSTIARVRNFVYYRQVHLIKEDLGLTMTVNPELAAADEISRVVVFPSALKVELFAKGKVELVEYKLLADSPMVGLSLKEVGQKFSGKALVCAVQRDGNVYIPKGDFVLQQGDKINVAASHSEIENFLRFAGKLTRKIQTVMIGGGGRIALYLAHKLINAGMQVKIIERDQERCIELVDNLPQATVIHGDVTDHDLLEEEGIERTDAFVALTGIDEENIVMSMYAKSMNIPKIITKVNNDYLVAMAEKLDIDTVIAPKTVTANNIVSYVRAMQNSFSSANVETMYRLINKQVEALEFIIKEKTNYTDIPLRKLDLKENVLVVAIVRGKCIIIPDGNEELKVGDSVVIVTNNQYFDDLSDILKD